MNVERSPIALEIEDRQQRFSKLDQASTRVDQFYNFLLTGEVPEYFLGTGSVIEKLERRSLFGQRIVNVAHKQQVSLSEVRGVLQERVKKVSLLSATRLRERLNFEIRLGESYLQVEELVKSGLFSQGELEKAKADWEQAVKLQQRPSERRGEVVRLPTRTQEPETPVHASRLAVISKVLDNPDISANEILNTLGPTKSGQRLNLNQATQAMVWAFNKLRRHQEQSKVGKWVMNEGEFVTTQRLAEYLREHSLRSEWPMVVLTLSKLNPKVLQHAGNREALAKLLSFIPKGVVKSLLDHYFPSEGILAGSGIVLVGNALWIDNSKIQLTDKQRRLAEVLLLREGQLIPTMELRKILSIKGQDKVVISAAARKLKSKVDRAAGREVVVVEGIKTATKYGIFSDPQAVEQAVVSERERTARSKQEAQERHARGLELIKLWLTSTEALDWKQMLRTLGLRESGKFLSGAANQLCSTFLDLVGKTKEELDTTELEVRSILDKFVQDLNLSEKEVFRSMLQVLDPVSKQNLEQNLVRSGKIRYLSPTLAEKLRRYLLEPVSQGGILEPELVTHILDHTEEDLRRMREERAGQKQKPKKIESRDPMVRYKIKDYINKLEEQGVPPVVDVDMLYGFMRGFTKGDIQLAEEKGFVKSLEGHNHHPHYGWPELVALMYFRYNNKGQGLVSRHRYELSDLIEEELKKYKEKNDRR